MNLVAMPPAAVRFSPFSNMFGVPILLIMESAKVPGKSYAGTGAPVFNVRTSVSASRTNTPPALPGRAKHSCKAFGPQ
jgi:hypothetical protein